MADSWIVIGAVGSVNPAKRILRVDAEARHAHQFEDVKQLRLRTPDGAIKAVRVTGARDTEQGILLTLAAGVTRDTVAAMRKAKVVIAPDEVKPRPKGIYIAEDFSGMSVVTPDGQSVGTVTDAVATPAGFVIELESPSGERMLVPVVDEVVHGINLDAKRITVGDISAFAVREDEGHED